MTPLAASLVLAAAALAAPTIIPVAGPAPAAGPATAHGPASIAPDIVHRTAVAHPSGVLAVSYQPRFQTSRKQTGIGPRASAGCLWTTRIAIERSVVDASGRPVAALTRLVGGEKVGGGMQVGYCRDMAPQTMVSASGDAQKLRGVVSAAAERDAEGLRNELAGLAGLGAAALR